MRKFASACLLVAVTVAAIAQTKTYEVKSGDTTSQIASRFGVSQKDLIKANHLTNSHKLKLGQKLLIPKASPKPAPLSAGHYKVRNGDHDWAIAARYNIKPSQLRRLNPRVVWTKLQVGQVLSVPVRKTSSVAIAPSHLTKSPVAKLASRKVQPKWGFPTTAYCVKSGDNDWTLAHKFGINLSKFRNLNPGVNTAKLKVGQYVRVPGTKATLAVASNVIRSRYAVISKDAVIVRKGASTARDRVTTVDRGTKVTVLDRQNSWYKLRFPKGTVGWVRGDMLKATKAPAMMLASNTRTRSKSKTKSYVASNRTRSRTSRDSRSKPSTFAYRDNGAGNGDMVNNAMSMLGARYRYGAASRGATDCSGMVLQAARGAGIKLPRTSREMSRVGQSVSKGSLKPGDLVFFNTRGRGVGHVGIYKGNGQFVHASSGKGYVTVSNLNEGYYSRRFVGAKRVGSGKSSSSSSKKSSSSSTHVAKAETSKNSGAAATTEVKTEDTKPADTKAVGKNPDEINP